MAADYVIVGAGSAGCVLAARLSEDPDVEVLLLEAGGPDTAPELHIPAAFPAVFKSSLDWDLLGEQEPGLGGRRLYLPRGRVIGGSGSINAMIYLRGNRARLRRLGGRRARRAGATTTCCRTSSAPRTTSAARTTFHGVGGPLAVSDSRSMHPLVDAMLEAAVQAGYELNPDLNVERQEGVGRFQLDAARTACAAARRTRTSTRRVGPAEPRGADGVFAQRIVFEGDRAVGVEIVRDGDVETVRAEREVILSAGAYQSPVLLMLSGIGPAEELAPLGIAGAGEPARRPEPPGPLHGATSTTLTDEPALFGILTPENFELLEARAAARSPRTSRRPAASSGRGADLPAPDVEFHFAPSIFFDEGLNAPTDPATASARS